MKSVIFVSGVYGVGKSTLCNAVAHKCHLESYSSSDLISDVNGEIYGANKKVKNKISNQNILIERVDQKLKSHNLVILAGHFCILGKEGNVEILPLKTYEELHISSIILLETNPVVIINHLKKRDGKHYSKMLIEEFLHTERSCAKKVSDTLKVPLFIHNMNYSDRDVVENCSFLKEVYGEDTIRY